MKNLQPLKCVVSACIFLLLNGCSDPVSYTKVELEKTKLIDGIESYQSVDDFKKRLKDKSLNWSIKDNTAKSTEGRPPYDIVSVIANNFRHNGTLGQLDVHFFNNRLMSTTFYPQESMSYINSLSNDLGLQFNENKEAFLEPHTIVRVGVDYKGQNYVNWLDRRLDSEAQRWIKKYT